MAVETKGDVVRGKGPVPGGDAAWFIGAGRIIIIRRTIGSVFVHPFVSGVTPQVPMVSWPCNGGVVGGVGLVSLDKMGIVAGYTGVG